MVIGYGNPAEGDFFAFSLVSLDSGYWKEGRDCAPEKNFDQIVPCGGYVSGSVVLLLILQGCRGRASGLLLTGSFH